MIRLRSGERVAGDLIVAADGLPSALRRQLFGEVPLRYSGQTCFRGIAPIPLASDLARVCREVWGGRHRVGFSAIGAAQVHWFATMLTPAGEHEPPERRNTLLHASYAAFPPPFGAILAATPAHSILRTDLYDLPALRRWSTGRVVLLGDAAHAMTPNLGQGRAQAIEDALVLADELATKDRIDDAVRGYEQRRRARVRRIAAIAWQFGRAAHFTNPVARTLRNALLRAGPAWFLRRRLRLRLRWLFDSTPDTACSGLGG